MSYETNPILNRIKLSKGWKTSSFPTKSLNYSRDVRVWFKLYLFLKVYLLLYGLRLLTYEVRISDKYTKGIFLFITKLPKKKKLTSKWKGKSFLKGLKSPLSSLNSKKGRFLLYLDLQILKKKIFSFFNNTNKILLSRAWFAKPKTSSWVNTSFFLYHQRKLAKLKYQLAQKKKAFLRTKMSLNKKQLPFFHNLNKTDSSTGLNPYLNHFFWKKKERNVFSLLTKMQKDINLYEKHFRFLWSQNLLSPNVSLRATMKHLTQQLQKKRIFLKRVSKIYAFLQKKNSHLIKSRIKSNIKSKIYPSIQGSRFKSQWKKKKIRLLQFHFWLNLSQELSFAKKMPFFLSPINQRFFVANKKTFLRWNRFLFFQKRLWLFKQKLGAKKNLKLSFSRVTKNSLSQNKIFALPVTAKKKRPLRIFVFKANPLLVKSKQKMRKKKSFLTAAMTKKNANYTRKMRRKKEQQQFGYLRQIAKTIFFQKPAKITFKNLFLWTRLAQKKTKKRTKGKLPQKQTKNRFLSQKIKKQTRKSPQTFYRFSFRHNYRKFLTLSTHVKLKYLLQDLIKDYFALTVVVKISWPLIQFKNLNFFRLLFPKYKIQSQNNKVLALKISSLAEAQQKKYIYVGQTTKHIKFIPQNTTSTASQRLKKKKTKRSVFIKPVNFLSSWKKRMKKKNKYLALKTKMMNTKSEKRLALVSNAAFSSSLLTTLTLFVKYLDPQPFADHLAKLIGKTKKHAQLLKSVESILRTFSLKRGLGYRIALVGRINGANKSKTLYLRKLNRNRSRQTFAKKVNFALAHARALIGTFGVKVWLYA